MDIFPGNPLHKLLFSVAAKHISDADNLSLNVTAEPLLPFSGDTKDSKCWKAIVGKMKAIFGDLKIWKAFVNQSTFDETCFGEHFSLSVHEEHLKALVEKTLPIWDEFGAVEFCKAIWIDALTWDEGGRNIDIIYRVPKKTRKGFSSIELKKRDLAKLPPLRIIGVTTKGIIFVANASVKGQGGRSVRMKGTNGVGKGPNDELTLNSDQHPDPHTRGTGSSIVGFGKIQVLSGDDVDIAKRNDFCESWWNNFLPPLAGAGTKSKDDVGHEVENFEANGNLDMGDGDKGDSKDEYYKQVEQRRALRTSAGSSSPEPVDRNHQITYQMENIGSGKGRDGVATPDINCDFDPTPHVRRTGATAPVGIMFSRASNNVEVQEASSSGHNGRSGAGSGSDEGDQSTGSASTDTNERLSRHIGGDEHDEDDRDEENDEDRNRVGELESGTRRSLRNSTNMRLIAIFTAIAIQSTSAIIALGLVGLSPLAKKLFTGVLVTNLVGFVSLYVALFPSRYISPTAAEILVRVGGAAAAFGFLLMMGIKLSLSIVVPACVIILAASVLSFMP